ncbi:MAG: PLDc N-terminal domain-containing protein [Nanoarchaeota archaeon]
MGVGDFILWPFVAAFAGAIAVIAILVVIFWIWMLVDCAKRKFRNDAEKIIWIIAIVLLTWLGAFAYFIVVKSLNPKGVISK